MFRDILQTTCILVNKQNSKFVKDGISSNINLNHFLGPEALIYYITISSTETRFILWLKYFNSSVYMPFKHKNTILSAINVSHVSLIYIYELLGELLQLCDTCQ